MHLVKLKKLFDYIELSIHDEILEAYQLFKTILTKESNRN